MVGDDGPSKEGELVVEERGAGNRGDAVAVPSLGKEATKKHRPVTLPVSQP